MTRRSQQFLLALLIAAAVLAVPVLAQTGRGKAKSKDASQFGETLEVTTVEVPVQVIRDGDPVRGLTAADFELYDGRKQQEITGFDMVDLKQYGADKSLPLEDVPLSARRHFLLLFDFTYSDPTAVTRAREAAEALVKTKLHPSDLVAVATYSNQRSLQLVLGFTSDRQQIEAAVRTLGLPQYSKATPDPLALVYDPDLAQGAPGSGAARSGGGKGVGISGDAEFAANIKDLAIGFNRADRGEAQGRVAALTTAFEDLAKVLHEAEGRKYVVYLSEGFDASIITGSQDAKRQMEMAAQANRGETWRIDSEERYGSTGTLGAVQKMLEEFRRSDCTIEAVDIGGLRAGRDAQGQAGGQDSLFMMADQTGGEMYRNFNDLGAAMGEMLQRTSVTYVLSFQPEDLKHDGGFHKLRVEVKNAPRGTRVVFRPGFYAPKPYDQRSPLEKRFEAADEILSGEASGALETSVLAAPFHAEAGRGYVPVLVEIDGPKLLAQAKGDKLFLEIYAYAIAGDGTVADFLSQNLGLDLKKVRPVLEASGIKFFGDLDVPAGQYRLRVLVRDAQTGRSATRSIPVTVPEFGAGAPALAMPLFPEPADKWLKVQEAAGSEERAKRPYPFTVDGNSFMPAAKPVVSPDGEAQFVLVGYNLGAGSIPLQTQFLGPDGKVVKGPTVAFVGRASGASDDQTQLVLKLQPNGVAAGEYRLVASIQGQAAEASIPFVVSGS